MSNNLQPLLAELSAVAPEICRYNISMTNNVNYAIGDYVFWFDVNSNELVAHYPKLGMIWVTGRPALAWLTDALMGECERLGWGWQLHTKAKEREAWISRGWGDSYFAVSNEIAEAFLMTFIIAQKDALRNANEVTK